MGPCAGIEECLPTVGFSGPETMGGTAPDHGDFWQVPWTLVNQQGSDRLTLEGFGFSRPFRFRKQLFLSGSTLRVDYTLENLGKEALPFLYACHPLFAVDPGDRISLPFDVKTLDLYYSRNGRLGRRGDKVAWPVTSAGEVLDRAGTVDAQTAEMFYTGRLTDYRHCAIHRASTSEALEIAFSLDTMPYLGVWLCYGGWHDSEGQPQYAVALEPTTSPWNTLAEAVANHAAPWLAAGSAISWHISFTVSGPPIQDRREG
ncbi:MAG TPA: aldose epimerase [Bryocella sp.]|nr:aldose epimerase [Bryocella sp.]